MQMPLSSRLIFSFIGLSLPIAAHAEDMNGTHIFNPEWPPHAKFHDGQTLALSLLLGGLTLGFAWKPTKDVPAAVTGAGLAASAYFITQGVAIAYPGTAYFDPGVPKRTIAGLPAPVALIAAYLTATGVACWLGLRSRQHLEDTDDLREMTAAMQRQQLAQECQTCCGLVKWNTSRNGRFC